ncbi:hypothetical protein BTJ39_23535 [Izhakiella australiensis]|uniref:Uncharacterized protein n=1 Tax=Izhakiella australiensis TaxID=1926881 RepID=A0A1S8Y7L8_9GAMM|nr:hypothetical protein [Izhakiella australiensis]OON34683.1 hypothetical protein BTJ39_23535 [Izhakiella australiensis]
MMTGKITPQEYKDLSIIMVVINHARYYPLFLTTLKIIFSLIIKIINVLNALAISQIDFNYNIGVIIDKLGDIEQELLDKKYSEITFPYLARYLYLLSLVIPHIESYKKEQLEDFKIHYTGFISHYLRKTLTDAFLHRRNSITIQYGGANHEFIYIFDKDTNESLTEWTNIHDPKESLYFTVRNVLSDKLSEKYALTLPIDELVDIISLITGRAFKKPDWSQMKDSLFDNNLTADDDVYKLIKPDLLKDLFPNIRPNINKPSGEYYGSVPSVITENLKDALIVASTETLNILSQKDTTQLALAIMKSGAAVLSLFSPGGAAILGVLTSVLDQNNPDTERASILKEVDDRIHKALENYRQEEVFNKYRNAVSAYLMRMVSVENENRNKNKPSMGEAKDWEHIINDLHALSISLFKPERSGDFVYGTRHFVIPLASMYLTTIYNRLSCLKVNDNINPELERCAEFFDDWYRYLGKLRDYSLNDLYSIDDIGIATIDLLAGEYEVYDKVLRRKNDRWDSLCGHDDLDRIEWIRGMIYARMRMYLAINTGIHSLCQAYDMAASNYMKILGDKINQPLRTDATETIYFNDICTAAYSSAMNKIEKVNNYKDKDGYYYGGGWYNLTLPANKERYEEPWDDFSRDDCVIKVEFQIGNIIEVREYGPGDYNNFGSELVKSSSKGAGIINLTVPRGFRVIFYSEFNYGELRDKNNAIVEYVGTSEYYPDEKKSYIYHFDNLLFAKSMKVRIDIDCGYPGLVPRAFGRIPKVSWKEVGTPSFWTVGNI